MPTQPEAPALSHDPDAWKLFVFRKNRQRMSTQALLAALERDLQSCSAHSGDVLDALVRAGEIETGLADVGSAAAESLAFIVDHLAGVACGCHQLDRSQLHGMEGLSIPAEIMCADPEGFSYYGLNPLDFADLARRICAELQPRVAVIGIRSVGSTLGAVVAAALRASGRHAERITVRPEGEPYHRSARFNDDKAAWIRAKIEKEADFVVVDEGPGFSGSTFLSVARALVEAGVPCSRIVLLGSRPFATRNANRSQPAEWERYRRYTIDYASHAPAGAARCLGDGAWRELLYADPSQWPPCWLEQERIKYLSEDGQTLFKFEGLGRFGLQAREQASLLAQEGFSPQPLSGDQGYQAYRFVRGRPLNIGDLSSELLIRMAAYCALRARVFPAPSCDMELIKIMARINLGIEFGEDSRNSAIEIPLERPVYPDCRMLPHEWLITPDGRTWKTDAVGHGNGHQLPGPADIAWDLAGVIVEWRLTQPETEFFLDQYRRASGDNASRRVVPYLLLYGILRSAQCRMASASLAPRQESTYLYHQYRGYAQYTKALLDSRIVSH